MNGRKGFITESQKLALKVLVDFEWTRCRKTDHGIYMFYVINTITKFPVKISKYTLRKMASASLRSVELTPVQEQLVTTATFLCDSISH